MADELIENAEFGRKRKNEEDPILIAQRFLNIYRQIHIFNKQRQDEFDNMLLNLSPDIRILLSTLPGGSLLLEHIEELEQKHGLVSVPVKKDKSFNKKVIKNSLKSDDKLPGTQGSSNVIIDASFASELSSSLSMALQQTEKRYKEDIKALTETIIASQTAMAQMMKDILIASGHNINSDNDNAMLRVLQTPPATVEKQNPIEDTVKPESKIEEIHEIEKVSEPDNSVTVETVSESAEPDNFITEENIPAENDFSTNEAIVEGSELSAAQMQEIPTDSAEGAIEEVTESPESETAKEEISAAAIPPAVLPKTEEKALNLNKINSLAKDSTNHLNLNKKNKNKKKSAESEISLDNIKTVSIDIPQENTAEIDDIFKDQDVNTDFDFNDILGNANDSADDILNLGFDVSEKPVVQNSPLSEDMAQIRKALTDDVEEKTASSEKQEQAVVKDSRNNQALNTLPELSEDVIPLDEFEAEPVSLDDFADDTPVAFKEDTPVSEENLTSSPAQSDSEWEWEYVDDDGTGENSDDWEWEYVDDESTGNSEKPK